MSHNFTETEIENLNFEYSPSCHTKRYKSAEEAIQGHIAVIESETFKVRNESGFLIDLDVKYGDEDDEVLDVYYKESTAKDAPLFVYVHGGYWQMLTKDTSAYCVAPLVNAGYHVLIVNYSLCPKVPLTQIITQIKNCIKFILKYASEHNSKSVSFAGHSAGAHLIISALSDASFWNSLDLNVRELLKQIYLISGVYDLTELRYTTAVNNNNLLGLNDSNIKEVSPLYSNYSHLKSTNANGIQFNVYVGEYDSNTFQKQSQDISIRLIRDINESVSYCLLKNLDHFNIVEDLRFPDYCMTKNIIHDIKF
uniref:CSON003078 protein n=1 Tax=Culicoides sonorensis TaxID=179676 RepID=A0A336LVA8_CULSO